MSAFPEFRHVVLLWRMVATRRLRQHTGDWTRTTYPPEWRQGSDGAYRIEREPLVWDDEKVHQLTLLPQWSRIEQAVSSNSQLQAHFGHVVGSSYARSEIDLEKIMRYMLPWSDDRSEILLDGSNFEADYLALEEFLAGDSVTQLSMWLVRGVVLDKPIRLDDRTVLRKLSPLEVADCLRAGLIVPRHEILLPDDPFEGDPIGLFLSRPERKAFDLEPMPTDLEDFNNRILEKQRAVENLQNCAALADLSNLSVSSVKAESHDWHGRLTDFISGGGSSIKFSLINRIRFETVTPSKASLLRRYGDWLLQAPANSNLSVATRRLGYANERVRVEDYLLDTMIAAEALYLGGDKDTELRFRLAIHAAVWAEPAKLGATRREIYDFMKRAYDARSKVAHGNRPRASELKFRGTVVTLEGFCNTLNEIVRTGLVKAIDYAEQNSKPDFKPDWDQMIIK